MSTNSCSAAEIAEKKRIALEKLRAKKVLLSSSTDKSAPLAPQATDRHANRTPPRSAPKITNTTPPSAPTGASAFYNSMKQSHVYLQRQIARDAAHPYKRPPEQQTSPSGPLLALSPQKPVAPVFRKTINCRVYMVSSTRFAVEPSGYHAQMVEVFKNIPSKSYDNTKRSWSFALKDYELVHQRMQDLKSDVVMGLIPRAVVRLCTSTVREGNHSVLASIETTLAAKLMPFQKEGVCKAIAQHGRIMICDEMGLGKTYQALAIADFYRANWPLLVCTTASTRESWAAHVHSLLPSLPLHYTHVLTNNHQYVGDAKILITSYNMMERQMGNLMERKFGVLIFDESHTLKNSKAKCTVVADRLAMQAKQVILLSGTPALSRPLELYTQIQMVDRKFMSYREFTSRYCDGKQSNFGWDASGQSNLEELNVLLKHKFMIRRTKADVLPELAGKIRETVVLDPALVWTSEGTKEALNQYSKTWSNSKGRAKEEILLRFYAETAKVKARAVCAYIKMLIKDKLKFIVFAHHRVMMEAITDCLCGLSVNFIRIDGTTKSELRAEYVETFQLKTECRVALLSLKACNAGITLTAAEMIVFAELDWNPSTLVQAESRAHRIGQDKAVVCRYLMANKTADDVIWSLVNNKQNVLNQAGLFCDNLQDAKQTAAPTSSRKIECFFSPPKSNGDVTVTTPVPVVDDDVSASKPAINEKTNAPATIDLSKELANIDEIFNDDGINSTQEQRAYFSKDLENIDDFFAEDDDAFNDLKF